MTEDPSSDDSVVVTDATAGLVAIPKHSTSQQDDVTSPQAGKVASASEPKFVVSARLVASVAAVVSVACVTALIIVASIREADALATTALALAVIAFGAQLLSSASQAQSTTNQSVRSEQLNAATQTLLAEMQTTARSTDAMLKEQFGQLLRAFMEAATTSGRGKEFDLDEFEQRLMENIRAVQPSTARAATSPRLGQRSSSRPSPARRQPETTRPPTTLPFPAEEEIAPVLAELRELSAPERARLRDLGRDRIQARAGEVTYEGYPPTDADDGLKQRGFVHLVRLPEGRAGGGRVVHQLTDAGELAARPLLASGPVPDWAETLVRGLLPSEDDIPF